MIKQSPRLLTYARALASLGVDSKKSKRRNLEEKKFDALRKTWALLESYAADGFDERILDAIMEKKARMILASTSIGELRRLAAPPKPYYDGSAWKGSPNSVPEEELIWWSKASLRAPLSQDAYNRFVELFENFYGMGVDKFV